MIGMAERLARRGIEVITYNFVYTEKKRGMPDRNLAVPLRIEEGLHAAIVVRDMEAAFAKVRAMKVQFVSTAPQTLPPSIVAAAGIKAFYFHDPDGHNLELIYFPPDKGDPRWQEPNDKVFLGIDHTAIGISSTTSSLKFYRDLLGMRKVGESENFGNEQEHLNQVFGAHLQITAMSANNTRLTTCTAGVSVRRSGTG